jgi:hypothetical protein
MAARAVGFALEEKFGRWAGKSELDRTVQHTGPFNPSNEFPIFQIPLLQKAPSSKIQHKIFLIFKYCQIWHVDI